MHRNLLMFLTFTSGAQSSFFFQVIYLKPLDQFRSFQETPANVGAVFIFQVMFFLASQQFCLQALKQEV